MLIENGFRVVILKRSTSLLDRIKDLRGSLLATYDADRHAYHDIFDDHPIDVIVHCATHYGRGDIPPGDLIEANLTLPLSLLRLGERKGARIFINTDTVLDKRVSTYSLSKKQLLEWLPLYSGNMVCCNVAIEHFFGSGDDPTKFVAKLIGEFLKGVDRIELTPGAQKRDFIYIDDVVSAFKAIVHESFKMRPGIYSFEVGTGRTTSIRDFARLVRDLSGNTRTRLDFGAIPYRKNEIMESKVNTRALRKLGWRPMVALEAGLRRTIELMRISGKPSGPNNAKRQASR